MDDLETFSKTYLEQWEARSTVRNMGRFAPKPEDAETALMPTDFIPVVTKPAVVALGPAAARYLSAQSCYRMMEEIALLETDTVGAACNHLANGRHSVQIPTVTRQCALTISTDEAYHAFAAREFVELMSGINGIGPDISPERSSAYRAMEEAKAELPEEYQGDFRIVALGLAENTITDELVGLTKDTSKDNPYHSVFREHLIDEVRHQAFFRRLLNYLWTSFDPDVRENLTRAIPCFIDGLLLDGLRDIWDAQRKDLRHLGFDEDEIADLMTMPEGTSFEKSDHPMWQNMRRAMQVSGMLEDPVLCRTLEETGWSPA